MVSSLALIASSLAFDQPRTARSASRRDGTARYHTQRPRFSRVTSPASTRIFMWWLTVGCERPDGSTRSHAHTSSLAEATKDSRRSRIGSASAAKDWARVSAWSSSRLLLRTGEQHAIGSSTAVRRVAMRKLYRNSSKKSIDECRSIWHTQYINDRQYDGHM